MTGRSRTRSRASRWRRRHRAGRAGSTAARAASRPRGWPASPSGARGWSARCASTRRDVRVLPRRRGHRPGDTVALLWRKVFTGDMRDMVLGALDATAAARSPTPRRVHADDWKITACPHRGGAWRPTRAAARTPSGTRRPAGTGPTSCSRAATTAGASAPRKRVHTSSSVHPGPRSAGRRPRRAAAVVVWEDSTAVRRRILLRSTADGRPDPEPVRAALAARSRRLRPTSRRAVGRFLVAWHEEQFPVHEDGGAARRAEEGSR